MLSLLLSMNIVFRFIPLSFYLSILPLLFGPPITTAKKKKIHANTSQWHIIASSVARLSSIIVEARYDRPSGTRLNLHAWMRLRRGWVAWREKLAINTEFFDVSMLWFLNINIFFAFKLMNSCRDFVSWLTISFYDDRNKEYSVT